MWKTTLIYGLSMAVLLALLKYVEFRYFVHDLPLEFYIGLVAVMFTGIGVWAGLRLTRPKIVEVAVAAPFERDEQAVKRLGISKREFEVLELIAAGLSNQDIADRLFVSTSTVKTHVSNVLGKLEAGRRTEAIARAKEMHIIP